MVILLTVIGTLCGIATALLLWPLGCLFALLSMPLAASLAATLTATACFLLGPEETLSRPAKSAAGSDKSQSAILAK